MLVAGISALTLAAFMTSGTPATKEELQSYAHARMEMLMWGCANAKFAASPPCKSFVFSQKMARARRLEPRGLS